MIEAQVPEFADGGYWYVYPAIPEVDDAPGWNYGGLGKAVAWYAEIGGTVMVAVRVVDAVSSLEPADPTTVDQVLSQGGYNSKPFARISGL